MRLNVGVGEIKGKKLDSGTNQALSGRRNGQIKLNYPRHRR
jgi:hypothetical protein